MQNYGSKKKPPVLHIPSAPFWDRMSAHTIDLSLLILMIIPFFFFLGKMGFFIFAPLYIVYFTFCHLLAQQTIGKKLIGLQVVGHNHEPINVIKILLRDILGRLLCIATLFTGYFISLFTKHKRALHDLVSSTVVINSKPSAYSFLRFVLIASFVVCTYSIALYQFLINTSHLGTFAVQTLQKNGVQVSSIGGNLASGWKVDSFDFKIASTQFSLRNIKIQQDPTKIYEKGFWKAKNIEVKDLVIKVDPQVFKNINFSSTSRLVATKPSALDLGFLFVYLNGLVDQTRILNVKITDGEKLNASFENVSLSKLKYENKELSFESFKSVGTKNSNIEISDFAYNSDTQKLNLRTKLQLKKSSFTLLKKDIDLALSWQGSLFSPGHFRLATFDNRLSLDLTQNLLTLSAVGLSPSQYFQTSSVVYNLSMKLKNPDCQNLQCLMKLKGAGSFMMRNQKISFKNENAWLVSMGMEPAHFNVYDLTASLLAEKPFIKVFADEEPQDFVAQFYFKQNMDTLAEEQKSIVQKDLAYFKVIKERFDPNKPKHIDTFLLRDPAQAAEVKQ